MRTLLEEQGMLIVSCIIGFGIIGTGHSLLLSLTPMIEVYLSGMM